jgi:hypothetical protein
VDDQALKARFNPLDVFVALKNELVLEMNPAFSAGAFLCHAPLGRCPRLTVSVAPLALNTCASFAALTEAKQKFAACCYDSKFLIDLQALDFPAQIFLRFA